ncbi:hypothetical protein K491DRAFT_172300 [Lophiostoma macrostomum CBS 122681]|uniref:Oxidoreductase acuF-like C2H2 type zinc-finger domain-containing protein n=1 Tax=Lophiostoma macrostomum CBS 122681 TaxID=1314788 RepID=A0A6A6SU34_9PLEO|nr:hypothetical protein K491DRAFT_172300 [Lophiostoma macrostomum CBS 122681]
MTTTKPLSLSDRSDLINKWQTSACHGDEGTVSTAIVAALYDSVMGNLKAILERAKKTEPRPSYYASLEKNVAALFFWGRDFGLSTGDLDVALQFSRRLRDTVLTLLISLANLTTCGFIRRLTTPSEYETSIKMSKVASLMEDAKQLLDEPFEPVDYSAENIERLCLAFENMITSLHILGPSLESLMDDGSDDEEVRDWVRIEDRAAHEYFVDLIRAGFPSASKQLVRVLGLSNWERYNHVQKLRDNVGEEHMVDTEDIVATYKAKSEFYDSGLGDSAKSAPALSNYAATVVSSRAELSHKRLPPLPTVARSGEAFECEICHRLVRIRRTKDWKKHVFEDICAYTCLFIDCSSSGVMFQDRHAMAAHLKTSHGITEASTPRSCPLCLEMNPGDHDIMCLHFARHMEEISLGVLPQATESEDGSEESDEESQQITPPKVGSDTEPRNVRQIDSSVTSTFSTSSQRQETEFEFEEEPAKLVSFELLPGSPKPQHRARLALRVNILPHNTTKVIVARIRDFYGLFETTDLSFEDSLGNPLVATYANFSDDMVVYVRVIEDRDFHRFTSLPQLSAVGTTEGTDRLSEQDSDLRNGSSPNSAEQQADTPARFFQSIAADLKIPRAERRSISSILAGESTLDYVPKEPDEAAVDMISTTFPASVVDGSFPNDSDEDMQRSLGFHLGNDKENSIEVSHPDRRPSVDRRSSVASVTTVSSSGSHGGLTEKLQHFFGEDYPRDTQETSDTRPAPSDLLHQRIQEMREESSMDTSLTPIVDLKLVISEDDRLLIQLREEQNLPWKDIAARFQSDLGKTYQIPSLQMRLKRIRELNLVEKSRDYWTAQMPPNSELSIYQDQSPG